MDCGKSLVVPNLFFNILRHFFHEGQQGQSKHNGSLSGSFPISNDIKQRCVLAHIFFSIFFSIMFCEAKEDPLNGIYIHFRTDGNQFNLARTKPLMNSSLICCLLTTTPFPPTLRKPYIVKHFSYAAKNFGLTVSLKKTEVLFKPHHKKHTIILRSSSMAPFSTQWNTLLTRVA